MYEPSEKITSGRCIEEENDEDDDDEASELKENLLLVVEISDQVELMMETKLRASSSPSISNHC